MKKLVAALFGTAMFAALAQEHASLQGSWQVEWASPKGRPISATLNLREGLGTWTMHVLSNSEKDPCAKIEAPASLVLREGQPHVAIQPSKVLGGCTDSLLRLTPGADGTLKGQWRDGREVKLTKQ